MGAIKFGSGSNKGITDDILAKVHKHENKPVLDDLNDENGVLTYRGQQIVTDENDSAILASKIIETEDRKFVNKNEKDALSGITGNIQSQLDLFRALVNESMKYKGRFNNYASMIATIPTPGKGDTVFIDNDEKADGNRTIYVYQDNAWQRAFNGQSSNGWIASNTEPTSKAVLWLDTSKTEPTLKWFNGTKWVEIAGGTSGKIPASNVVQEKDLNFVSDNAKDILGKMNEGEEGQLMYNGILLGGTAVGSLIKDDVVAVDSTYSSKKVTDLLKNKQANLGYVPEDKAKKGQANGYAPLNADAKIDDSYLRVDTHIVADSVAREALTNVKQGDFCYEVSTTEFWLYENTKWKLVSKGSSVMLGKNLLDAERNPLYDDDELDGFKPGSIWINKFTKKAFMCTDATEDNAQWELMAGEITLNIGEVIPFKLDPMSYVAEEGKFKYEIPKMNLTTDFVELSVNGHEAIKDVHYTLTEDETKTYVLLVEELTEKDYIFGEIYKHDIKKAEEQMLKSVYDSNNNGKVDIAELGERTNGFDSFKELHLYNVNDIINHEGTLYGAKRKFTSTDVIDLNDWQMIKAEPSSLVPFTTRDLVEEKDKYYVTGVQRDNINDIPNIRSNGVSNTNRIGKNETAISELKNKDKELTNRLDTLKFTSLTDTPDNIITDAFVKTNLAGNKLEYIQKPLFPVKKVIDSMEYVYESIDASQFMHMKMIEKDEATGLHKFALDAATKDLKDMPKTYEHGKLLICNGVNMKYELVDKEDLTMSKENFTEQIKLSSWTLNETTGKYEYIVNHGLDSESLIISFIDGNKVVIKDIQYQVIDANSVKLIRDEAILVKITINCALGASNGYWSHIFDISKVEFVDDSRIRLDRGYSSNKIEEMIKQYAKKSEYVSKLEASVSYAAKDSEHRHGNSAVLTKFAESSKGNLIYNGKEIITEIKPKTFEETNTASASTITEIYNAANLTDVGAVLASELLIKNTATQEDLTLLIADGDFELVNVKLKAQESQKYQLGISKNTKVSIVGKCQYKIAVSAL